MEIWKDIEGFEGKYQISNKGNVKSLKTNIILKPFLRKGYERVDLYKGKFHKKYAVHRLVAKHFIENPLNKPQINHKDLNKRNNNVDNLEWCTNGENKKHSYKYGNPKRGGRKKEVIKYSLDGIEIERYNSVKEIGLSNISACCLGTRKQAHGFIWRYAK